MLELSTRLQGRCGPEPNTDHELAACHGEPLNRQFRHVTCLLTDALERVLLW